MRRAVRVDLSVLTRQTVTGLVAAVAFVVTAGLVVGAPVPYVAWAPGRPTDTLGSRDGRPLVDIRGTPVYPTSGELDLTTVLQTRADSHISLPQALASYLLPAQDALPRSAVYPPGTSADQAVAQETELMQTSQDNAVVAALRAAKQQVTELPVVSGVTVGGPADSRLRPGDLILAVDGRVTPSAVAVQHAIRSRPAGSALSFRVLRDRVEQHVLVTSAAGPDRVPRVGITVDVGYRYSPHISFDLGDRIGGPSAGLIFSLAIYDKITPGALLAGRHVAGTGTISPDGTVGGIGGIQEKISGAQHAGATVFLVPAPNCPDLAGLRTDLDLVKVAALADAVTALRQLDAGRENAVPRC